MGGNDLISTLQKKKSQNINQKIMIKALCAICDVGKNKCIKIIQQFWGF